MRDNDTDELTITLQVTLKFSDYEQLLKIFPKSVTQELVKYATDLAIGVRRALGDGE